MVHLGRWGGRAPLPEGAHAYRKTGAGWQTRINADLRKARKLKAG